MVPGGAVNKSFVRDIYPKLIFEGDHITNDRVKIRSQNQGETLIVSMSAAT